MTATCPSCRTDNPPAARFCQNCGSTMVTSTGDLDRTKVYSTSTGSTQLPAVDTRSIVNRVRQTYGEQASTSSGQALTTVRNLDQREHTVLAIDVSGSMAWAFDQGVTKLQASIRAGCNLVTNKAQIDADDEVGLVCFDNKARIEFDVRPLHTHKIELIRAIQSLAIEGGTDLNEGLLAAEAALGASRSGIVQRVVMLTDGEGGEPLSTAELLKSRGVVIDVIGVGKSPSDVNEPLLKKMTSYIQGELHYRFIKDHQSLIAHYTQLAHKTKTGT